MTKLKYIYKSPLIMTIFFGFLLILISMIGSVMSEDIIAMGITDILGAIAKGFEDNGATIILILALGGILSMLVNTNVIKNGLTNYVKIFQKHKWLLIAKLVIFFGLLASISMSFEMLIIIYPVMAATLTAAGFDKKTSLIIIVFGTAGGLLASAANPLTFGMVHTKSLGIGATFGWSDMMISFGQGIRWLIFIISIVGTIIMISTYIRLSGTKLNIDAKAEKMTRRQIISLISFFGFLLMVLLTFLPWGDILGTHTETITGDDSIWNQKLFFFGTSFIWGRAGAYGLITFAGIAFIFMTIILLVNAKELNTDNDSFEETVSKSLLKDINQLIVISLIIATAGAISVILGETGLRSAIAMMIGMTKSTNLITYALVIFIVSFFLAMLIPNQIAFLAAFGQTLAVSVLFTWGEGTQEFYNGALFVTMIAAIAGSTIAQLVSSRSYALTTILKEQDMTVWEFVKETKYLILSFTTIAMLTTVIAGVMINSGMVF